MTVGEVRELQNNYGSVDGAISSAAGKYQVIDDTMDWLMANGILDPTEVYDAEAQDRAAMALLRRRGYDRYKAGKMPADRFLGELSKEWASIPGLDGASAYAGDGVNKATPAGRAIADLLLSGSGV
jgi:muramidase (phage lysozyme)